MSIINAEMELALASGSVGNIIDTVEGKVEDSGVEDLEFQSSGLDNMKDRIQGAVSTGFMEGFEGSRLDELAGGVLGGAAGSLLPGALGPPGAAAGAAKGADEGASGLAGAAAGKLGKSPVGAALGVIAGGVSTLARASPAFGAIFDILQTAVNVALMPIGNIMAQHLMPFAMQGMQMAQNFNALVSNKGLKIAFAKVALQAIKRLPKGILKLQQLILTLPIRLWEKSLGFFALIFEQAGMTGIASRLESLSNGIGFVGDIVEKWPEVLHSFWGAYFQAIPKIIDGIMNLPSHIANGISTIFTTSINSVLGGLESAIGALPGVEAPDIPRLATGGIVTNQTTAMVGESGPEAVIPLDRFNEVIEVEVDFDATNVESQLDTMITLLRRIADQDPVEISSEPKRDRGDKLL